MIEVISVHSENALSPIAVTLYPSIYSGIIISTSAQSPIPDIVHDVPSLFTVYARPIEPVAGTSSIYVSPQWQLYVV